MNLLIGSVTLCVAVSLRGSLEAFFARDDAWEDELLHCHKPIHSHQWQMLGPRSFTFAARAGTHARAATRHNAPSTWSADAH